ETPFTTVRPGTRGYINPKPLIPGNDLAPGHRPHRLPRLQVDVLGNEVDGPIGLEDVYPPRVPAPRGGGHLAHAAAAAGQIEVGAVVRRRAEPCGRIEQVGDGGVWGRMGIDLARAWHVDPVHATHVVRGLRVGKSRQVLPEDHGLAGAVAVG